jgi:hypothetical protein
MLAEALPALQHLDLGGNQIGDEGARALWRRLFNSRDPAQHSSNFTLGGTRSVLRGRLSDGRLPGNAE